MSLTKSQVGAHYPPPHATRDLQKEAAGDRPDEDHYLGSTPPPPAVAKAPRSADSELKLFAALVRLLDKVTPARARAAVRYLSERYDPMTNHSA